MTPAAPFYRQRRAAVMQLLVASVRGEKLDRDSTRQIVGQTPLPAFMSLTDHHRVGGFAYESLRVALDEGHPIVRELHARYMSAATQHMRVIHAARRVGRALDDAGCEWAVVKGPVLVELLYGGAPGRRQYGDLDLLVHPADFGLAIESLTAAGGKLHDRNWKVLRRDMRGEVHLSMPGGVLVDLHWNLVNMYRGHMRVDSGEVIARRQLMGTESPAFPTLDVVDATLHLALHAALSGGDRLLWLKDIERAVTVWRPEWEAVVERARRWRIGAPVGIMLIRAREVVGADVPDAVIDRLIGSGTRRVARLVDRISPWQYAMGRLAAPATLMTRSVAKGPIGAPAWILWRSVRNLDPGQERRSLTFTPRGDARDRRRFIEAVVAVGRRSRQTS